MTQGADLRQHTLALLELARKFLQEDGDLDPIALIVTGNEQLLRPLELQDEAAKMESCRRIVAEAKERNALAIVTIFLARSKKFDRESFVQETYSWGNLQESDSERCILVTLSGLGIRNWAAELPFKKLVNDFAFDQVVEFSDGVDLGLFPGWSDQVTPPRVS